MSDWADEPTDFADLEGRVLDIYAQAMEAVECAEKTAEMCKLFDVALKAIRLQGELREKTAKPKRVEALIGELEKTREAIARHHAGNLDGVGAADDRGGDPPTWRQ